MQRTGNRRRTEKRRRTGRIRRTGRRTATWRRMIGTGRREGYEGVEKRREGEGQGG